MNEVDEVQSIGQSKCLIRIGLTKQQLGSCQNCMIWHLREQPTIDLVVDGIKVNLLDILAERFPGCDVELAVINATIVEEKRSENSSSHRIQA